MATLGRIELPDALLHSIERRAAEENTSVEELVVRELENADLERQRSEDSLLSEIRESRKEMSSNGLFLTDDMLKIAKNWGRD
jgi:hypothetical protein